MADPSVIFKEERKIRTCAISPDGSLVAIGTDECVTNIIDVASWNVIYTADHEEWVYGIAWYPDETRFVSTCHDGTLTEFNRLNGQWSHQSVYQPTRTTISQCCAVSANGLVAVDCFDYCVVILDSNSNYSEKQTIKGLAGGANRVSFSSNGSLLAIGCDGGSHYVYGLNQSNGQYEQLMQQQHHHSSNIWSLSFNPSDSLLIVGSSDNTASLWNVPSLPMTASTWPQSPSFVFKENTYATVYGACFTGDGCHVIITAGDTIRICRVSDGGHVGTIQAKGAVSLLSFHSPSGRLIGVFTDRTFKDGYLRSWLCPPYNTPLNCPASYVDARIRLKNAQATCPDTT